MLVKLATSFQGLQLQQRLQAEPCFLLHRKNFAPAKYGLPILAQLSQRHKDSLAIRSISWFKKTDPTLNCSDLILSTIYLKI